MGRKNNALRNSLGVKEGENMKIKEVTKLLHSEQEELSHLLIDAVDDGASLGFIAPVSIGVARAYWKNVLQEDTILFIAYINNELVGTVQLHLCNRENGLHRAEVAKLMVHSKYRRNKVAHELMKKLETRAKEEKRTLLVLDTRAGDVSNYFYQSIGYHECGRIPNFTYLSSESIFQDTILYYKELGL
jgi:ribosomal protein S18 acetylase RimI-like enzyme